MNDEKKLSERVRDGSYLFINLGECIGWVRKEPQDVCLADDIAQIERQMDALLEALGKIAALNVPIDIVDVMDETARKAVDIADAAIKSVEE